MAKTRCVWRHTERLSLRKLLTARLASALTQRVI